MLFLNVQLITVLFPLQLIAPPLSAKLPSKKQSTNVAFCLKSTAPPLLGSSLPDTA